MKSQPWRATVVVLATLGAFSLVPAHGQTPSPSIKFIVTAPAAPVGALLPGCAPWSALG